MKALLIGLVLIFSVGLGCSDDDSGSSIANSNPQEEKCVIIDPGNGIPVYISDGCD